MRVSSLVLVPVGSSASAGPVQPLVGIKESAVSSRGVDGTSKKQSLKVSDIFSGSAMGWLASYKRYYIFKIGNDSDDIPKVLLVHDNIPTPELLLRALDGFKDTISLEEFLKQLEDSDSSIRRNTHFCLLVLSDFSGKSYNL